MSNCQRKQKEKERKILDRLLMYSSIFSKERWLSVCYNESESPDFISIDGKYGIEITEMCAYDTKNSNFRYSDKLRENKCHGEQLKHEVKKKNDEIATRKNNSSAIEHFAIYNDAPVYFRIDDTGYIESKINEKLNILIEKKEKLLANYEKCDIQILCISCPVPSHYKMIRWNQLSLHRNNEKCIFDYIVVLTDGECTLLNRNTGQIKKEAEPLNHSIGALDKI